MPHRKALTDFFLLGIAAASPRLTLPAALPADAPAGRTLVLGCGKAAAEMADIAAQALAGPVTGCVVTRHGHGVGHAIPGIAVIEAGHPVPDAASLTAGERMLALAASAGPDDRVIFLLSGGGSSLLCAPADGISFADKAAMTDCLVRSGCGIAAINLVRRHLSRIKGGRLGALAGARGAQLRSYVISDVANDDPALVASGPSLPAPFDPEAAIAVLRQSGWALAEETAAAIRANRPQAMVAHDTHLLATNADALAAIAARAQVDGWNVVDLGGRLAGDAAQTGREHAAVALEWAQRPGRHLLLSGGELTVTGAARNGRGGPNLEYLAGLLAALPRGAPVEALAGDSDGIDGSEDNAGGYIRAGACSAAAAEAALASHTTHDLLRAVDGLIVTGPTRTNVNDIRMIAIDASAPRG